MGKEIISNIDREKLVEFYTQGYITKEQGSTLAMMLLILEETYKDSFEMVAYRDGKDLRPSILIWYKQFILRNSEGDTHIIKDLIVQVLLIVSPKSDRVELLNSVYGLRLTLTKAESQRGYWHSHLGTSYFRRITPSDTDDKEFLLPSGRVTGSASFCLGSAELGKAIMMFAGGNWDINSFRYFLYTIDEYVKWESVEGGPYIHMNSISSPKGFTKDLWFVSKEERDTLEQVIEEYLDISKVDIEIEDDAFTLLLSEKTISHLTEILPVRFLVQRSNGTYYTIVDKRNHVDGGVIEKESIFLWKGVPVPIKIEQGNLATFINRGSVVVHPSILAECRKIVSVLISNKILYGVEKTRSNQS